MKRIIAPFLLALCVTSAVAQEVAPMPPGEVAEGFGLIEQGARLLFKGLMSSLEPAMEDMGAALTELEPAMRDLLAMMGDIGNYHAPEMQENGDIIIRRKPAADGPQPGAEIDL